MDISNINSTSLKVLIRLLLAIAVVFVLIETKQLLVPLFFAVLFAYALYPAATKLESAGMPRILTTFFPILTTLVILAGSIYGVILLVASFTEDLPQIRGQPTDNIDTFKQFAQTAVGISEP
ncbi:MAG: AI-2E family transporter [Bacteroidota bacterium]